jgi:hypothetical protein
MNNLEYFINGHPYKKLPIQHLKKITITTFTMNGKLITKPFESEEWGKKERFIMIC